MATEVPFDRLSAEERAQFFNLTRTTPEDFLPKAERKPEVPEAEEAEVPEDQGPVVASGGTQEQE